MVTRDAVQSRGPRNPHHVKNYLYNYIPVYPYIMVWEVIPERLLMMMMMISLH